MSPFQTVSESKGVPQASHCRQEEQQEDYTALLLFTVGWFVILGAVWAWVSYPRITRLLFNASLLNTAMHCTALHCTALHCTALYYNALHCTALHCTEPCTG